MAEYCIVQPSPAAELGPPQASEAKISSISPLVATTELQSSFSLFQPIAWRNQSIEVALPLFIFGFFRDLLSSISFNCLTHLQQSSLPLCFANLAICSIPRLKESLDRLLLLSFHETDIEVFGKSGIFHDLLR